MSCHEHTLNFERDLNSHVEPFERLEPSNPAPSTLPQTAHPRQYLSRYSRLQCVEPLIDFRAHRVFAFLSAIVGQALEARLPKRGPYDDRGQIESFNRVRDLLLAQPPRAGGDARRRR